MNDTSIIRERYLRAQLDGDRAGAVALINGALDQGISCARAQLEIVQEAQYEIGRLWETNAIGISTEHQATAISQLALATIYARLPRHPENGKRVVLSCVEGELHDMGARIGADFLEMEGFDVRFLGANVPAASLASLIEEIRPDLVALSATMPHHLPALEDAIAHVRATSFATGPILIGGRAVRAVAGLDAQGFAEDASAIVAEARRLLSGGPPASPPFG